MSTNLTKKYNCCTKILALFIALVFSFENTALAAPPLINKTHLRVPLGSNGGYQRETIAMTGSLASGQNIFPLLDPNLPIYRYLTDPEIESLGFDEHGHSKEGKAIEDWRNELEKEKENLVPELQDVINNPVSFTKYLVDNVPIGMDKYKLYRALMNYASFIRHKDRDKYHSQAHLIAIEAVRLKPTKEEHEQAADRCAKIFIEKLKEAEGKDIDRLKQAARELVELEPDLRKELQKEHPWHYDLIRHFIGYIGQIPEDDSDGGGDITMIGSPARFVEYLEDIYKRSGIGNEDLTALIGRIKERIKDEYQEQKLLADKQGLALNRPNIIRQINLDAEAESDTNKFKWLADDISKNPAKYNGYNSIMLVGTLQTMGVCLSPYASAGLYFDPQYGNDDDFRLLVATARKNGIEIILDVVLEHTGNDISGRPFPDRCYSERADQWGNKLNYSQTETVVLTTWFLRRVKELGINWIRCDQMGGLGEGGYRVWENAKQLGLGMIAEWEDFPAVPQADFIYSKSETAIGIHDELVNYSNDTSFHTLESRIASRLSRLPQHQSSLVIFDDHDEQQKISIVDVIGKDRDGKWNINKLKAYYLALYMAWFSQPGDKRKRISIMEHSGTAEGYPYPISFMYGAQGFVNLKGEAARIFPGFAEFSEEVRMAVREIIEHKGEVKVDQIPTQENPYRMTIVVYLKNEAGEDITVYSFTVNLRENYWRAEVNKMELDKLSRSMHPAARLFLKSGQDTNEPRWLKLQVVLQVALGYAAMPIAPATIREEAERKMKSQNALHPEAKLEEKELVQLLNELAVSGLLEREGQNYRVGNKRLAAIWANDIEYIKNDIEEILNNPAALKSILLEYERHCLDLWSDYPVEAYYALEDAISMLGRDRQERLLSSIDGYERDGPEDFYEHSIFDVIRLQFLPSEKISSDKLEIYGSNLIGRTIVIFAAEISRMAGGLSRVLTYKTVEMMRLIKGKAGIAWLEPYYKDMGEIGEKVDEFDVEMIRGGQTIQVRTEVFKRIKVLRFPNEKGEEETVEIEDYLIRDRENYYVGKLYRYGQEESRATVDEFTNFISKAAVEFTNRMAEKAERTENDGWNAPILNVHDGQCLPAAFWRRYLYRQDSDKYRLLKKIPVFGVTHTYNNRTFFPVWFRTIEDARAVLGNMGIAREYHWYFLRRAKGGDDKVYIVIDFSSGGINASNMANGVARMQTFEIDPINPSIKLAGITNGDLRELSAREFRKILRELYPDVDVERPEPFQVIEAKKEAKRRLEAMLKEKGEGSQYVHGYIEIDPDKMVDSYSGRLVPEKLGMGCRLTPDIPVFTPNNIKGIVKEGVQLVIFGNVQPYDDSVELYRNLKNLAEEIQQDKLQNGGRSKYKGTFIFVDKFRLEEQILLLAATDLQVQVSRRRTGASEYSESDVTANGGKQLAAPWLEGITQLQGIIFDRSSKRGNTIIPYANTEQAYLDAFMLAIDLWQNDRAVYYTDNIPPSRKLGVRNTVASYLKIWNKLLEDSEFDIKLDGRNDAMTAARINLFDAGIHITDLTPSVMDPGEERTRIPLSNKHIRVKAKLTVSPAVTPPPVFIETNAASEKGETWDRFYVPLKSFDGIDAVYEEELPAEIQDFDLTWMIGDVWVGTPLTDAKVHGEEKRSIAEAVEEVVESVRQSGSML